VSRRAQVTQPLFSIDEATAGGRDGGPLGRGGTIGAVNDEEIRAFAGREWRLVEEAKRRYWVERKRVLSPAEALSVAEGLRCHVRALRPDWPSPAERAEDLETHAQVAARLRSVR
jgi:hypothetical protein